MPKVNVTERKALSSVLFVAGCLLLLPRQWVAAGVAFALSVVGWLWARAGKR